MDSSDRPHPVSGWTDLDRALLHQPVVQIHFQKRMDQRESRHHSLALWRYHFGSGRLARRDDLARRLSGNPSRRKPQLYRRLPRPQFGDPQDRERARHNADSHSSRSIKRRHPYKRCRITVYTHRNHLLLQLFDLAPPRRSSGELDQPRKIHDAHER